MSVPPAGGPLLATRQLQLAPPRVTPAPEQLCPGAVCLPRHYDQLQPPRGRGAGPLEVRVSAEGVRALEFEDKRFTVSFSMFLSVQWTEDRLIGPEASATQPFRVATMLN